MSLPATRTVSNHLFNVTPAIPENDNTQEATNGSRKRKLSTDREIQLIGSTIVGPPALASVTEEFQVEKSVKRLKTDKESSVFDKTLPSHLWGNIASFAEKKTALNLRQVCKAFCSQEFSTVAFAGHENENVNSLLGKLIRAGNPLISKLFQEIGAKVTNLSLGKLSITATTLKELSHKFPNVTTFRLSGISNVSEITSHLFNFEKLQEVDLTGAYDLDPLADLYLDKKLQSLPSTIRSLRLSYCNFHGEEIAKLAHLTNLQELAIRGAKNIGRTNFNEISPTLQKLDCESCEMTDPDILKLSRFSNLRELNISLNRDLSGTTFNYLPSSLVKLKCGGTGITDSAILQLSHLINLRTLNLRGTQVTGATFDHLPRSITQLFCKDCTDLTDFTQFSCLSNLEVLIISLEGVRSGVGNDIDERTFRYLPVSIRILGCSAQVITDLGIKNISHLSNLQELNCEINHITGSTLQHLPRSIQILCLDYGELTDDAIPKLSHLTQLKTLYLEGNDFLTEANYHLLPLSLEVLDAEKFIRPPLPEDKIAGVIGNTT